MILPVWWWWLWSAAGAISSPTGVVSSRSPVICDEAHKKCSFREDCTKNLLNYMKDCADVLSGTTARCPWACRKTLISLMSHEAGMELATCDCEGDTFCKTSKQRLEVCRPEVSHATADDTVVPCLVAEWICAADTQCSTALQYYFRLCKSMFHGRKCSRRCNNSLNILGRQEKAAKLRNCYCDGSEDFPCTSIQENTQRLCFGRAKFVADLVTTAPETHSGCRTSRPDWWIVPHLLAVLWTFRTCDLWLLPAFSQSNHRSSFHFRIWPWWWTSERQTSIGGRRRKKWPNA